MAKFFCDALFARQVAGGEVVYQAEAQPVEPGEPVELAGVDNLTLDGDLASLLPYFGKVIALVVDEPQPRGDSGQVGN